MKRSELQSVLASWLLLLYFDCLMRLGGFARVHQTVRREKVIHKPIKHGRDRELSHAIDLACVLYFKPVLCLQRSAALALLLRRHGIEAEMVIGAQLLPFLAHAWVEVGGGSINDKPYVGDIFQVLERC
jgi:Transglutaminase-like superfamily